MKNMLMAVFCFCVMLVSTATAQPDGANNAGQKTKRSNQTKKKKTADKQDYICQYPADVTAVKLSQTEVPAVCQPDNPCTQIIEVTTVAIDLEDSVNVYVYTVSGGKITGSGANVKWDLSGVEPGIYVITAGIDSGSGRGVLGRAVTKEVKVVE